ncbi:serine-type D-Ala-D-Ala carboxypeptidase [Chlamydia pneumoniae TW-183]|uniref:D-Ala-D-Ala Carboxypeptidase n=2 Tax=Chlamydia pneumoniae TaxID=83558 RepID=Q9Z7N2_CHLPN|nr:D-alanyl-D-alanine carboxypeptidase family protein [Chlamydia pneumoniae]AAD18811.1 D-Ala-D-Ala Carboxypeptidase [Chlamydia pneumoniae CWL029]AAF37962.1 D-alanyl-D-alanine carboxypeptidase [Chlamydia pneumoniae AR39]AAP98627.1 serine-type D-Ala-D-Ala carboxypeptidase [Chlamydia pneumoniae TW-183]CRI33188.1 D-Ala-D-Ala Carboxypeptidase [Chlamydia pneumoniae]CRI36051.1 D-Ala-D-Ala Carboxypeptidase [Chlamydia pneumoniae]
MKRPFFTYLCIIFYGSCASLSLHAGLSFPEVRGATAAVVHADSGKVFYDKDIDAVIYPASMTKIATALFILKHYPTVLDTLIKVKQDAIASITPQAKKQSGYRSPPHWLETDGSTIQLHLREELLGWDLFHALLVCSANDAANVLAMACCGSVEKFMDKLNFFLKEEIGCTHTHFNNPHGLHHPNHYTTTRDLISIMRCALKEPPFRGVISTTSYKIGATNLHGERILSPTNKLLLPGSTYHYPPALGGKTGTTKTAGKNLIMAAEKNNRLLVTIATGYSGPVSDLYQDVIALCETVFNEPLLRKELVPPSDCLQLEIANLGKLSCPLPEGLYYDFYASEDREPLSVSFIAHADAFPIEQGDLLGHWVFYDDEGKKISSQPFYAPCRFERTIKPWKLYMKRVFTSYRTYMSITMLLMYFRIRKHRKYKNLKHYSKI